MEHRFKNIRQTFRFNQMISFSYPGHLNTLAGTIYMDFLSPWQVHRFQIISCTKMLLILSRFQSIHSLPKQTEKQASNKVKLITVAVGILVTSLVFIVEQLGSVFQVGAQLSGISCGALFTMFILGITSRTANTKVPFELCKY